MRLLWLPQKREKKKGGKMKCQKCNKYNATIKWVGEGGVLDFTHGFYQEWCKQCALKEQIKHCEKAAKRLPRLKEKLMIFLMKKNKS